MSEDQLQPSDTLDDRRVEDVLDEGYSPPDRPMGSQAHGTTARESVTNEPLADRLSHEEPDQEADPGPAEDDPAPGGAVGDQRAGRLVAPDEGLRQDTEKDMVARDVGIDGAGASAEEAAMHVVADEPEPSED